MVFASKGIELGGIALGICCRSCRFCGIGINLCFMISLTIQRWYDGTITALPIVFVGAFAPKLFKTNATLTDKLRIVEIPSGGFCIITDSRHTIILGVLRLPLTLHFGIMLCAFGLSFGIFQFRYMAVYHLEAICFRHGNQALQRVFQMDSIGQGNQLIENFRPAIHFLIVWEVGIDKSHSLTIASACIGIGFTLPIELRQLEE